MTHVSPTRARQPRTPRLFALALAPAAALTLALLTGCASTRPGPAPGTPINQAANATNPTQSLNAPGAQGGIQNGVVQAAPAPMAVNPLVPQGETQQAAPQVPPPPPMDMSTASRQTGRFSLQYVDIYHHQRNAYGNFVWLQSGDQVSLELRSPLGTTLAVIRSVPGSAALEIPGHPIRTAASVNELMQHALGFAMPVNGLRYWLQPVPSPDSPAQTEQDPQNTAHLKEIRQDGWIIDYLSWADAPATGPRLIDIERPDPPLTIKLVLDK